MNRGCYGHRFELEGGEFYRCMRNGKVVRGPVTDDTICPECKRVVYGSLATVMKVRKVIHVTIDCGLGEVEILEDEFPGGLEQ